MEHWLRRLSPKKQSVHEEGTPMSSTAKSNPENRAKNYLDSITRLCGLVVLALGLIELLGWLFNVPGLLTIIPSSQPMALISAFAFLCLGASVVSHRGRSVAYLMTRAVVLCIGVATALSHACPIDCFIGHLLGPFRSSFSRAHFPLEMSFISSLNFSFLGAIGISDVAFKGKGGIMARQAMLVLLGFFTLLSAIGILYSITLLRSFGFEKDISIVSAVCFCLLYLAEIFQRPQEGMMVSLLNPSESGKVVRRILVFVFIIPIAVGGIVAMGNNAGFLDSMQSILLTVIVTLLSLSMLVIGQGRVILQSEWRFHESWNRYHELFEHIFDGVVVLQEEESDGRFFLLEINEAAATLLGVNRHGVLGRELREAFPSLVGTQILPALQEAQQMRKSIRLSRIHCMRQKSPIWLNGALYPFSSGRIVLVMDDITAQIQTEVEKQQLASQLDQSQKMEAIGQLAGGIAHDFNNILQVIGGYCDVLKEKLAEESPMRKYITEIARAAQRAATLTAQLLAFSRKQVLRPRVVNTRELVRSMENMLTRVIGEDIELRTFLNPDTGNVLADPGQIERILLNLTVNARDAMPSGGKLTIETANRIFDEVYVREHLEAKAGQYVRIAVSDTGVGMIPETLSHIFEPFFTTKEKGKGTGLGLSTVYGIMKQSDGYINCYSELGKGTTFTLYLPLTFEEPEEASVTTLRTTAVKGETILLVEDDEAVRKFTKAILEKEGYLVIEAAEGEEALSKASTCMDVALLVTDMVMPRMSGRELARKLKEMCPVVNVLFVSGYTENAIVHNGVLDAGLDFLQKPFSSREFLAKVREILDRR